MIADRRQVLLDVGPLLLVFVLFAVRGAIVQTAPRAMGAFVLCVALSVLLPRTAVSEEALTES
jgi:hypothetical protein